MYIRDIYLNKYFKKDTCSNCLTEYWRYGKARKKLCGEGLCSTKRKKINSSLTLNELRDISSKYLEEKKFLSWKRYRLNCTWKEDSLFTQASIYPFFNDILEKKTLPKKKFYIIQRCVRLLDIESKKHLIQFEMLGIHNFLIEGSCSKKKKMVIDCFKAAYGLLKKVGLKYFTTKLSIWEGGGLRGPCVEVYYNGTEVATLVLISETTSHFEGEFPFLIDIGVGLERLAQVINGKAIHYQKYSKKTIKILGEYNAEILGTIIFLLSEKVNPGRQKAHYTVRKLMSQVLNIDFEKILLVYEDLLNNSLVELISLDTILEFFKMEREKLNRKKELYEKLKQNKKELEIKDLQIFYESHGIRLELIQKDYPEFYLVLRKNEFKERKARMEKELKRKYSYSSEIQNLGEGLYKILSVNHKLASGGQDSDRITVRGIPVTYHKFTENECIIKVPEGLFLSNKETIKVDKRKIAFFAKLHTFTHLLDVVIREVSQVSYMQASKITKDYGYSEIYFLKDPNVEEIKNMLKEYIDLKINIFSKTLSKEEFESGKGLVRFKTELVVTKYKKLRVVIMENLDAQPCSGDHVKNTYYLNDIVIYRVEKTRENVWKIYYK